jgi:hypothetical protein
MVLFWRAAGPSTIFFISFSQLSEIQCYILTISQGLARTEFLKFANNDQNIEGYVVRPGAVLSSGLNALLTRLISKFAVKSDELGIVMADLAVNGGSEKVMMNVDIVEKGRALLDKRNKGGSKTGNGTDV